jgi:fructose-1,6-bisphosphatase I
MTAPTLDGYLDVMAGSGRPRRPQIAEAVRQLAQAAVEVSRTIQDGALGTAFADMRGPAHGAGDDQRDLDLFADARFLEAARRAGVDYYASEELELPVALGSYSGVAVAVDPLDGSSNIETNVSIGTIFAILPSTGDAGATFAQPGHRQLAAGFFVYGPQLTLALTLGERTHVFVYCRERSAFVETHKGLAMPAQAREFAINTSNYRHWEPSVRLYVDDCLKGGDGPCGQDYNMRWIASLVAEAYRILMRGGVYLYPGDARKGYREGRLRLVYEANPIAMLIEGAGGAATDGLTRILDLVPRSLHQRTPLVFGSVREVERITRYQADPSAIGTRDPLFGHRGLLRV